MQALIDERNQLQARVEKLEGDLAQVRAESAFQRQRAATAASKTRKFGKELRVSLEQLRNLQAQHQAHVEKSNAAALDLFAQLHGQVAGLEEEGSATQQKLHAAFAANKRLQQKYSPPGLTRRAPSSIWCAHPPLLYPLPTAPLPPTTMERCQKAKKDAAQNTKERQAAQNLVAAAEATVSRCSCPLVVWRRLLRR